MVVLVSACNGQHHNRKTRNTGGSLARVGQSRAVLLGLGRLACFRMLAARVRHRHSREHGSLRSNMGKMSPTPLRPSKLPEDQGISRLCFADLARSLPSGSFNDVYSTWAPSTDSVNDHTLASGTYFGISRKARAISSRQSGFATGIPTASALSFD